MTEAVGDTGVDVQGVVFLVSWEMIVGAVQGNTFLDSSFFFITLP